MGVVKYVCYPVVLFPPCKLLFRFIIVDQEVLQGQNYDTDNIFSPVNVQVLDSYLRESGYPDEKRQFLVDGFSSGFDLGYRGSSQVTMQAPNLRLVVGTPVDLWNKVIKEVKAGRYAGPFDSPPFPHYIQSPLGLVPKDGDKTRLIFHLSYPKGKETSVNANTPQEFCSVKYPDIDQAVRLCIAVAKIWHLLCWQIRHDLSV